jgi:hypothetical protein
MVEMEKKRGRGRNEYPVRCAWNAILAGVAYQHETIERLRCEHQRNAELRQVCGFDLILGSEAVPQAETFSRFFKTLYGLSPMIERMFHQMLEAIAKETPELGKRIALDSKGICSYGKPNKRINPVCIRYQSLHLKKLVIRSTCENVLQFL